MYTVYCVERAGRCGEANPWQSNTEGASERERERCMRANTQVA